MASVMEPAHQGIVLIVDNDPTTIESCQKCMEPEGFRVHVTKNGQQGVDVIRRLLPDVVLLDLMIPNMGGFQILEQLKADPDTRDISILVHSVRNASPAVEKALQMGADDFLKKPFDADELIARIKKMVSIKQSQDAFCSAAEELISNHLALTVALKQWEREAEAFRKQCETIIINILAEPGVASEREQAMTRTEQARALINRIVDLSRLRRPDYEVLN